MNYIQFRDKYEIITKIGEGGFGVVYKARNVITNRLVTLKKIKKKIGMSDDDILQSVINEIENLKNLKGLPNIIKLNDFQINEKTNKVFIAYDYCEFDLHDIIYHGNTLTIQHIKSFTKQMISALLSVHSKGYIHCDIKPRNFLVTMKNKIKLIDFGQAIKIDEAKDEIFGTYIYNAPEIIFGSNKYGKELDIWSLGCTLYEMLTKERLFPLCNTEYEMLKRMKQIYGCINKNNYQSNDLILKTNSSLDEFLERKMPNEFKSMKNLLKQMLQLIPENRISLSDAINHPSLLNCESYKNLPFISIEITSDDNDHLDKRNRIKDIYVNLRPRKIVPKNIL